MQTANRNDGRSHKGIRPEWLSHAGAGARWPGAALAAVGPSAAVVAAVLLLGMGTAWGQHWASPHQTELERHRQHPVLAALIGNGGTPLVPLQPRAKLAAQTHTVFGYLPYWIDADYYEHMDLDVLTHISAFSVEVNADGTLGNDHGWPWTALINRAHAHGVRVILTATLFGNDDVLALLASEAHRQTFFLAIREKIRDGNADGVNIDFEGSGANGWPGLINGFLEELSAYLHHEIPGCEVSFAGPAVDWGRRYDLPGLAASCDYIFIMGYAFNGSWSDHTGPSAPLTGGSRNITTTVTGDYGAVADESPEKLILGVPYYGAQWQTTGTEPRAEVADFIRYLHISATLRDAGTYGRQWDPVSQTPWYGYQEEGSFYQVWCDDAESLGLKYDLALANGLRGVGMWALGYDGDRPEPWDLLVAKVGRREIAVTAVSGDPLPVAFGLAQNSPNPFNQATLVEFAVPGPGTAAITLFDVLGRRVGNWELPCPQAGSYGWRWDGRAPGGVEASSGLYLYRLRFTAASGAALTQTKRMVLGR